MCAALAALKATGAAGRARLEELARTAGPAERRAAAAILGRLGR